MSTCGQDHICSEVETVTSSVFVPRTGKLTDLGRIGAHVLLAQNQGGRMTRSVEAKNCDHTSGYT